MLSGRRLDLLDPSALDVEIADIAHGIARVARPGTGQTEGRAHSTPSPSIRLPDPKSLRASAQRLDRQRPGSPFSCTTPPNT